MAKIKAYFYLLPAVFMVLSAIGKLAGAEPVAESFSKIGLSDHLMGIGIMELLIATVFVIPKTRNIGFFLVCSYWGGAIAADLAGNNLNPAPVIFLILFWVAMYLQKPQLFFTKS